MSAADLKAQRTLAMRNLRQTGATLSSISRDFGLTSQRVAQILNEPASRHSQRNAPAGAEPWMWNQSRRLYVAEFKNGVIKVGITSRTMQARFAGIRFRGLSPVRAHISEPNYFGFWAERELLLRIGRIAQRVGTGREWFTGIRFEAAKHMVEQISRRARQFDVTSSTPLNDQLVINILQSVTRG